jgi:hypothetical protein
MASAVRKSRVKEVPLSEVKDDLSRYLREAESREILMTRREPRWRAYRVCLGGRLARISTRERSPLSSADRRCSREHTSR